MSVWGRRLSTLCWLIVAALLVRAASGGGFSIGGFLYVADAEPTASYAVGGVLLGVALALALGFAIWPSATLGRISALFAVLTVLYAGWWFLLDAHTSGLVLGAAAVGALALAVSDVRRPLVGQTAKPRDRPGPDRPKRDARV
jgi:hypothetical protein